MAGYDYPTGGLVDKLVETFAGAHDFIGGQITGLYDSQGNIRRGLSGTQETIYNLWSGAAIPLAAPFAASQGLPAPVWNAFSIILK